MNEKLREALAIVEKYGMKGDVIYKEIEALDASKQEPLDIRKCEFCGCETNAKRRACCDRGRTADDSKQEPQATTTNEHTERAELTDAQIDEIAEQHATGQDDQDRYIVTTAELHEIIKDAAAMLEAQRPALRPLTDEQIDAVDCVRYDEHDEVDKASIRDFARAIIAEFCRINGITGEAQPALEWVGHDRQHIIDAFAVARERYKLPTSVAAFQEGALFMERALKSGAYPEATETAKLREKNAGQPAAVPDDIPAILKKQAS